MQLFLNHSLQHVERSGYILLVHKVYTYGCEFLHFAIAFNSIFQVGNCDISDSVPFMPSCWLILHYLLFLAPVPALDLLPTTAKARCCLR